MDYLVHAGDLECDSPRHIGEPAVGLVAQAVAGGEVDERQRRQLLETYRLRGGQLVTGGQHRHERIDEKFGGRQPAGEDGRLEPTMATSSLRSRTASISRSLPPLRRVTLTAG